MIVKFQKNQFGFSLIEVILAVGLFGLFSTALIGLLFSTYGGSVQANDRNIATLYAQQGIEAVWSIRRQGWNLLDNGNHGLMSSGGYWEFFGTADFIEPKFTRTVLIENACRDISGSIVICTEPGAIIDLRTKKVVVAVNYESFLGVSQEVSFSVYLTLWQNKRWLQTNWAGGPGQNIWSGDSLFESEDGDIDYSFVGEIRLKGSGGNVCGSHIWSFDNPGEYVYDSNKIEVVSNQARLKSSSSSGTTINSSFDINANNWIYYDWSQDPGDPDATGTWYGTGGNPNGFVDVNLPADLKNKILGGYWQQVIAVSTPATSATCAVDWTALNVNLPSPGADSLYVAVYLENVSGPPSTSPIAQKDFTTTFSWESVSQDCTSILSSAGTYYYKIAIYLDAKNQNTGPIQVGFDNAFVDWSSSGSYPSDSPSINPFTSYIASGVDSWQSFSEVATKNGGEIYYQLSDDDGVNWYYWDGSNWTGANSNQYNIADTVNSNIGNFPTSTGEILFKAFLQSDGSQQVFLDQVVIGCNQIYDWNFNNAIDYSFDTNKIEINSGWAQLKSQSYSVNESSLDPGFEWRENTFFDWTFSSAGDYTFDINKIEIISDSARLKGTAGSLVFQEPYINSLEFDTSVAYDTDVINVTGDYYVVAYRGSGNDGFVKTFTIDAAGNIGNTVIDTLEFDTSNGYEPSLVHVAGDYYAVAYRGTGNDGFVKTFTIDAAGNIGNATVDTLEFDTADGYEPSITHVTGDYYAVAYRGTSTDGFVKTFTIDAAGDISNATVDTLEFDTADGYEPSITHVTGDYYAVAYRGVDADGFVKTFTIDATGNIGNTVIDTLEFDTANGYEPSLVHVAGDYYAVAYRGTDLDGFVKTFTIDATGNISNTTVDTLEFDENETYKPSIVAVAGELFAVAYRGVDIDGYLAIFNIDSNGLIDDIVIDSYEFDNLNTDMPDLILVSSDILAVTYSGDGSDGFVRSVKIISNYTYPSDNPSIFPNGSYSHPGVLNWSGFVETATKNGGEIYYQLSEDNGAVWKYFDGSSWSIAVNASDYNTASTVNSQIASFPAIAEQIKFKAFLSGSGSQQVILDNIRLQMVNKTPVWSFGAWDAGGGEVTPAGSKQTALGNPDQYVNILFPGGSQNDELGGYWEQAITIDQNEVSALIDFDYRISQYVGIPNSFSLYVFVDSVSGAPTIGSEVWSQAISGTTGWVTISDLDASLKVLSAGTYYLKIAVWLDTGASAGPFEVNFDNTQITWSKNIFSYPNDSPSIYPINSYNPTEVASWNYFGEIAEKNGGEIYYQLSDDDGLSWQYWNGSGWGLAGTGNYNSASIINSNIGSFSTSTGKIKFKAFLSGDGTQFVRLDNVRIGLSKEAGSGSGFSPFGSLVSSAFDMSTSSAVSIIEWDEVIPSCSPACDIRFQIRGADDSGNAPGVWSDWYGFAGPNTYYTTSTGSVLSPALNMKRWLQYRVELIGDTMQTPVIQEVRIDYLP